MKPTTIQMLVAEEFGIRIGELLGSRRRPSLVRARHVAMWLERHVNRRSFPAIAALHRFNGRTPHHTTVMHACGHVEELLRDADFAADVAGLVMTVRLNRAA